MRVLNKDINEREKAGSVTLVAEEPEDMWHLYNLIRIADFLTSVTSRKVKTASVATGASSTQTVTTTLTIKVTALDFDPSISELRVTGRVRSTNEHVAQGSYHTMTLEIGRRLTIYKSTEAEDGIYGGGWDSVALQMLKEATDIKKKTMTYAVVMQEGLANICAITEFQTIVRQRLEASVPKKRGGAGAQAHEKGVKRFFEVVGRSLLHHLDVPSLVAEDTNIPLLLASPGFIAQEFLQYLLDHATETNDKVLAQYLRKSAIVAHASSGHVHSLNEAMKSPAVLSKLSDTRFARDMLVIDRFFELVRKDEGWAWYGPKEVERAVEKGAVGRGGGVLLISTKLFRSFDIKERRRWVALVDQVRLKEGGEIRILSSDHDSGKRLEGLGNIGAILTFPLLDLDEGDSDEEEGSNGNAAVGPQEGANGVGMQEADYDAMAADMGF